MKRGGFTAAGKEKRPRRSSSFGAGEKSGLGIGDGLLDELIEGLRLLLFGDGADDGITDDVALLIDHIGGGKANTLPVRTPASLPEAKVRFR